jgi:NADH:ubiquinone oxidoreductase subunit H
MRYDQLMQFGWKRMIPLSLLWIVLATIGIGFQRFGAPWS